MVGECKMDRLEWVGEGRKMDRLEVGRRNERRVVLLCRGFEGMVEGLDSWDRKVETAFFW